MFSSKKQNKTKNRTKQQPTLTLANIGGWTFLTLRVPSNPYDSVFNWCISTVLSKTFQQCAVNHSESHVLTEPGGSSLVAMLFS